MTISVTQLNNYIHGVFDIDGVLNDISVCGEVTNVKSSRDGWYFSLKDENSAIDCFCYASATQPEVGKMVVAEGKINYWTKSGRVSFFVRRLTVSRNDGAAYLQFLQLKEKLQKEGLFDEVRKRPLPVFCRKIGVVTSATGAVIHDIENVIHRRQPFTDILLYPVKVQGAGADLEIAQGVNYFSSCDVDVVIVGRGGGSNEDLSAFNSECVVRAVAQCKKPVVSAVGHGVDFTLCDFASDKRAVTPTEAGEFVTVDSSAVINAIQQRLLRASNVVAKQLSESKNRTEYSLQRISSVLKLNLHENVAKVKGSIARQNACVQSAWQRENLQMQNILSRLSAANPANVLKRGYAYVRSEKGRVYSASQVTEGQKLTVTFDDGSAETVVTKVNNET